MIQAVMKFTTLEVEVSGQSIEELAASLAELQSAVPAGDREFDPYKKLWIVKNVDRYQHLPWVARALEDRRRQPPLF